MMERLNCLMMLSGYAVWIFAVLFILILGVNDAIGRWRKMKDKYYRG